MSIPKFIDLGRQQDLREQFISKFPNMGDEWTVWKYEGGWHVWHRSWADGERVFGGTLDDLEFSLRHKSTGGLNIWSHEKRTERKLQLREMVRRSQRHS